MPTTTLQYHNHRNLPTLANLSLRLRLTNYLIQYRLTQSTQPPLNDRQHISPLQLHQTHNIPRPQHRRNRLMVRQPTRVPRHRLIKAVNAKSRAPGHLLTATLLYNRLRKMTTSPTGGKGSRARIRTLTTITQRKHKLNRHPLR